MSADVRRFCQPAAIPEGCKPVASSREGAELQTTRSRPPPVTHVGSETIPNQLAREAAKSRRDNGFQEIERRSNTPPESARSTSAFPPFPSRLRARFRSSPNESSHLRPRDGRPRPPSAPSAPIGVHQRFSARKWAATSSQGLSFCPMDAGAFHDGFGSHRPLGEIDWWRFARWAGVHAHPLRSRVGTQPAATHPLVNREIPYSLRGDLGQLQICGFGSTGHPSHAVSTQMRADRRR